MPQSSLRIPSRPCSIKIAEWLIVLAAVSFASIGRGMDAKTSPASQAAVTSALSITPAASIIVVGQTEQLHAVAALSNGTSTDMTQAVDWKSRSPSNGSVSDQGVLACRKAGTFQIAASLRSMTATATVACSTPQPVPQLIGLRLAATPSIIRSQSPFRYQVLATYSDSTTVDVTANATWVTDPSIASINSQGLVSCNNPGNAGLTGSFSGMTVQTAFTCILHSITPKPGFVESAETFDGPFASWVNVKTVFGAKGDGVTDDSVALQAALTFLARHSAVLWIPRGTYVLTQPLGIKGQQNFSILGEDPLATTISWQGPQGGTMLTLSGCRGFNIGRLTLDGHFAASEALEVTWDETSGTYYPTRNSIHDSRIINVATGIHTGWAGETTVSRVHFHHNTVAGISLGDWNALNFNVIDSLFTDNAIGVTNWYGAGAFNVSNSVFVRSTTSDIVIGNTGPFSFRSNLSVDSRRFLQTGMTGASANIVIQGNTIDHPGSSPIATGTPGTLMILDNQFLRLDPNFNVLYSFCYSPIHFISLGNTYSVAQPFAGNIGKYTSVDEAANPVDPQVSILVPGEIYIPPFSGRRVFDLMFPASESAIQTAINDAAAIGGGVHLAPGTYTISHALEIPANANIALLGDGSLTVLEAADQSLEGTVLRSYGQAVEIKDLRFRTESPSKAALIEVHIPDLPSTRVYCDECTFDARRAGLEVDGLDDAAVELRVTTSCCSGGGETIHGGTARQDGRETLGSVDGFMTSSEAYQVDLGGHFLLEDGWRDSGQAGPQFVLTGNARVSQQGGAIYTALNPAMTLLNYVGELSILGSVTNSYLDIGSGTAPNVLIAGVIDTSETNLIHRSDSSAVVTGLSNSMYSLSPVADTGTPTPAYLEYMMAMARTQRLSHRYPQKFESSITEMSRLVVDYGHAGVQLVNSAARYVGTYSISPSGGEVAASKQVCGSGEVSLAGSWVLEKGGDGYVGLSNRGSILSEDVAAHLDGEATVMAATMSSARDRWMIEAVGDGSVRIINRATGNVLTQSSGDCAYATTDDGISHQRWLIAGAN